MSDRKRAKSRAGDTPLRRVKPQANDYVPVAIDRPALVAQLRATAAALRVDPDSVTGPGTPLGPKEALSPGMADMIEWMADGIEAASAPWPGMPPPHPN